jgi:hypothetical protein
LPTAPSSPLVQTANIVGRWPGGSQVQYSDPARGLQWTWSCDGSLAIDTQQGTQFQGAVAWQGSGSNTDFYCTYSSRFTATMTGADSFTLRMERARQGCSAAQGRFCCERVSGDDVFTGQFTDGPQMTGSMTDHVSCTDPSGRPFDGERTITFSQARVAQ